MSKAILEFPAPESCMRCDIRMTRLCTVHNKEAKRYTASRHPDCPLRIELSDEEQIKLAVKAHEELSG